MAASRTEDQGGRGGAARSATRSPSAHRRPSDARPIVREVGGSAGGAAAATSKSSLHLRPPPRSQPTPPHSGSVDCANVASSAASRAPASPPSGPAAASATRAAAACGFHARSADSTGAVAGSPSASVSERPPMSRIDAASGQKRRRRAPCASEATVAGSGQSTPSRPAPASRWSSGGKGLPRSDARRRAASHAGRPATSAAPAGTPTSARPRP